MSHAARLALLGLLTAIALALRLWHIGWGLPAWYHPDEVIKADKVLAIAGGDLNPHYFWHPSFMLYAAAAATRIAEGFGMPADPMHAVLAGRVVNAMFGTLTVPLTYLLGCTVAGTTTGLGAAALLALSPLAVFCAHYLKEDVALTFWIVAAAIAALAVLRRGGRRDYLIAGLCCGAAISSKYAGILALALPVVAHQQRERPQRADLNAFAIATIAGFLMLTPFALLDVWHFIPGIAHEGSYAIVGKRSVAIPPLAFGWTVHLRYSLLPGLGWLATAAGLIGFVLALRQRDAIARILTVFVALGYTIFENSPYKPPPNFDRYVLPLLPVLAVLAMAAIDRLALRSRWAARLLLLLMILEPGIRTVRLLATVEPDTRAQAAAWMEDNVPTNATVLLEGELETDTFTRVVSYAPELRGHQATYSFSLAPMAPRLNEFDYLVASSFIYDRYVEFGGGTAETRAFYNDLLARQPIAVFDSPAGSYGFHNPTIRIYRGRNPS